MVSYVFGQVHSSSQITLPDGCNADVPSHCHKWAWAELCPWWNPIATVPLRDARFTLEIHRHTDFESAAKIWSHHSRRPV